MLANHMLCKFTCIRLMYIGILATTQKCVSTYQTEIWHKFCRSLEVLFMKICWCNYGWSSLHILTEWFLGICELLGREICVDIKEVWGLGGGRDCRPQIELEYFLGYILTYIEKGLLTPWEIIVDILKNMCWHQRFVWTRGRRNCLPKFWGCWLF